MSNEVKKVSLSSILALYCTPIEVYVKKIEGNWVWFVLAWRGRDMISFSVADKKEADKFAQYIGVEVVAQQIRGEDKTIRSIITPAKRLRPQDLEKNMQLACYYAEKLQKIFGKDVVSPETIQSFAVSLFIAMTNNHVVVEDDILVSAEDMLSLKELLGDKIDIAHKIAEEVFGKSLANLPPNDFALLKKILEVVTKEEKNDRKNNK